MTVKEFFKVVWDKLKFVLLGIGAAVLAILGIKKAVANKQIKNNDKLVDKIENQLATSEEIPAKNDEEVKVAEKVVEEAEKAKDEAKSTAENVNDVIEDNKKVLEKYKNRKKKDTK